MSDVEPLSFDDFVALLRVRIGAADAIKDAELHSFKTLMADYAKVTPDQWYWEAFEELEEWGHLDPASVKAMGGDANARLSATGRRYLRSKAGTGEVQP